MSDMVVSLRINASDDGASRVLGALKAGWREFSEGVKDGAREARQEAKQTAEQLDKTAASVDRVGNAAKRGPMDKLVSGAKAFIGLAVVREITRMADAVANLEGRITLVTSSQGQMRAVMGNVFDIAQRTGAQLNSTGMLYSRLAQSLGDVKASQTEMLGITETVNKAMAVSGTASSESAGAIVQLSQAFASGALRGDEFNSVNEAAPRIMQAVADSMGKTRGQLRALAEDGKITSDILRKALTGDEAAKIGAEFEKLPLTIGRAWQRLMNSVTLATGRISKDSGAFELVARAISGISEAVDYLTPRILTFIAAWTDQFRRGYQAAVDLANVVGGALQDAFVRLTEGSAEAADQFGNDLAGGMSKLLSDVGRELMILPTSLQAVVTVIIGELDKLRITAGEKFDLLVIAGKQAWLGLKSATMTLANDIRILIGGALDASVLAFAAVVSRIASAAGAVGLDSLQARMIATVAGLREMATAEANARIAAEASTASYAAEAAALEQQAQQAQAAAAAKRFHADTAIQAALDEREAALALLDVKKETAALENGGGVGGVGGPAGQPGGAAGKPKKAEESQAAKEAAAAMKELLSIQSRLSDENEELKDRLAGATDAQIEFNRTQREAAKLLKAAGGALNPKALEAYERALASAQERMDLSQAIADGERLNDIFSDLDGGGVFDSIADDVAFLGEQIKKATDPEQIERLQDAIDSLQVRAIGRELERGASAVADGLRSLQGLAEDGSREYQAMQIAIDAANVAAAIGAVLNQGMGDPYTAFARMAAMAAAVASLVGSIGSFASSGFTDTAAKRQASQGTGSVLGDPEAKSESIANAVEITADATSELVGINRGMLRALLSLQAGLGSAAGMLARGAGDADFSGLDLAVAENSLNASLDVLNILGGSSSITDQGIVIMGGALTEMLSSIMVGAYQEVQSRSWAFGSTQTNEGIVDITDELGSQFQLVIGSIIDTVREGATALGLLPADIEAALAAFRVEEIRISLQDLTAEEQQAELEAVFSQIFDGLAGSVVPFIEQFQQVGEGLGETLVRVATGMQVTQEAVRMLGFALDETDPERFAQISEGLIQSAGGIEAMIEGMQTFVDNFATDGYRFQVAAEALGSALSQVGLSIPATSAEMFDLMRSLDATTEEGREQIATLLRLSGTAAEYYGLLEEQLEAQESILSVIGSGSGSLSDFARGLLDIRRSEQDAIGAANALAVARGREGASAVELARIHEWTSQQIAAAIRRLQAETLDLIAQLYGGPAGTLDEINRQISELEGNANGALGSLANDSANLFEQWRTGIQSVQDYLDSMLLGDLSALTPEEQLAEARRQLEAMQQAALGGDADALAQLPQMADAFLRLLRGSEASGADYNTGFQWVRDLLQQVTGIAGPTPGGPTTTVQVTASAELQALYAQRDAMLAQQEGEHRRILAEQLAANLHDLAIMLNTPILEMIALQGVSLAQLAADLGINLQDLNAASVQALGDMATTLGTTLGELTGALGITLADLSGGLAELTARVGIDLGNLTAESTQTLALLATSLGADLTDLATSLGVSLGALADQQSLLNQALTAEIQSLPADQSAALAPLLDAITNATTEADANAAIQALEDAVNLLAPDIRTQLAPYLADVFPADALSDLDYLGEIQSIAADQLGVLGEINQAMRASNHEAGVPGYATGTGYVPNTGLAMIHEGEAVIPAGVNAWMHANGYPTGGGSSAAVVSKLAEISERIDRMDRNNVAASRDAAQTVDMTGQRSDRNIERVLSDMAPRARSSAFG